VDCLIITKQLPKSSSMRSSTPASSSRGHVMCIPNLRDPFPKISHLEFLLLPILEPNIASMLALESLSMLVLEPLPILVSGI
jgi:hypothetical protein